MFDQNENKSFFRTSILPLTIYWLLIQFCAATSKSNAAYAWLFAFLLMSLPAGLKRVRITFHSGNTFSASEFGGDLCFGLMIACFSGIPHTCKVLFVAIKGVVVVLWNFVRDIVAWFRESAPNPEIQDKEV